MSDESKDSKVSGAGTMAAASVTTVTPTAPARDAVDDVVDSWVDAHVRGSPVAQATDAWNHFVSVIEYLKAKIREVL